MLTTLHDYLLTRASGSLLSPPSGITPVALLNAGEVSGSSAKIDIGFEFEFEHRKHTQFVAYSSGFVQLVGDGTTLFPSGTTTIPDFYISFDDSSRSGSAFKDLIGDVTMSIRGTVVASQLGYDNKGESVWGSTGHLRNEGNSDSLRFITTDKFSIFSWMKAASSAATRNICGVMSGGAAGIGWLFQTSDENQLGFQFVNSSGSTHLHVKTNAAVRDTTWHHVGVTYDGTATAAGTKLFIDGVASSVVTYQNGLTAITHNSASRFVIFQGTISADATAPISGSLDEFAIWKNALSEQAVKKIYEQSLLNRSYLYDTLISGSSVFDPVRTNNDPILSPWSSNLVVASDNDIRVRYWIDNVDPSGNRKLVVEFRCYEHRTQTTTLHRVLRFQVVLYERTNTIEYRYGRSVVDATTVAGRTEPMLHAAMGVRGHGHRFRNFFTGSYRLGGSISDPLLARSASAGDWPGDSNLNVYVFRPEKSKTKLLASGRLREETRSRDSKLGSYPIPARSGDNERRGKTNSPFDDRNTLIFGQERDTLAQATSYPTRAPAGHPALLPGARSDIVVFTSASKTGSSVDKFAVDDSQWFSSIEHTIPKTAVAFNESALFEQNSGHFFETGSALSDVWTKSLEAPLRSKATIRISLPITNTIRLQANSASLYYYGFDTKMIELISGAMIASSGALGAGHDAQLFGPFGNVVTSGSTDLVVTDTDGVNTVSYKVPTIFYSASAVTRISASTSGRLVFQDVQSGSALLNPVFAATSSQFINIENYINHPFILEKAVVNLPLRAGSGWLSDRTRARFGSGSFKRLDFGGPCITVALLRQENDSLRELIFSGTIIPTNDNIAEFEVTVFKTLNAQEHEGFRSFASPNAVVFPNGTTFTGSVDVKCNAAKANGFISYAPAKINNDSTGLVTSSFADSLIVSVNTPGRALDTIRSGRSIFRSDIELPQKFPSASHDPPHKTGSSLFFYEKQVNSPYLLLPGDNLIFAVSKYRPVRKNANWQETNRLTGSHDVFVPTGSIEIALYGSFLRRSEVADESTLNQYLSSNALHETIGSDEPVLDQYDVERNITLSGSYTTHVIEGSLITNNRNNLGNIYGNLNFTNASHLSLSLRSGSDQRGIGRYVRCFSENQRYWDSLVPDPIDIFTQNSASAMLFVGDLDSPPPDAGIHYYVMNPGIYKPGYIVKEGDDVDADRLDTNIDYEFRNLFPFETKYSEIKRTSSPLKKANSIGDLEINAAAFGTLASLLFLRTKYKLVNNFIVRAPDIRQVEKFSIAYLIGTSSQQATKHSATDSLILLTDFPETSLGRFYEPRNFFAVPPEKKIMLKHLYGFGKSYHTISSSHNGGKSGSIELFSTVEFSKIYPISQSQGYVSITGESSAEPNRYNLYHGVGAKPIGWKYGLISALPFYNSAVFRRDKFGQPRDMLEQCFDSKFFIDDRVQDSPVQIKFVDSDNRVVDSKSTDSSNLSFEATSSLPFFDDTARNRENPIDTALLGTDVFRVDA